LWQKTGISPKEKPQPACMPALPQAGPGKNITFLPLFKGE